MKVQIRSSVFETNSSSVHSVTMCNKIDWEAWQQGDIMYCPQEEKLLPTPEAEQYNETFLKEHSISTTNLSIYDIDYINDYKSWGHLYLTFNEYFEIFGQEYSIFNKEFNDVVAFGHYGYN